MPKLRTKRKYAQIRRHKYKTKVRRNSIHKRKKSGRKKHTKKYNKRQKMRGGNIADKTTLLEQQLANPSQRQANMLNAVCGQNTFGNCLDFGEYTESINNYFNRFSDFSLVSSIKRIGNVSNNGFVRELEYMKNSFRSYTALKFSAKKNTDNLFYEYYVGKHFINSYTSIFPCFVNTYNAYIAPPDSWEFFKNIQSPTNDISHLEKLALIPSDENDDYWKESCKQSKYACIMIQHFSNFTSLHEMISRYFDNIKYEFCNLLYQVYFVLAILRDTYTHYDLHANNVFLYKPYAGQQFIQMYYHSLDGTIISFPSEYIVKIIDYGRNYIRLPNSTRDTNEIVRKICALSECNTDITYVDEDGDAVGETDCGDEFGYYTLSGNLRYGYHITPNQPNCSHDLLFARMIMDDEPALVGLNIKYKTDVRGKTNFGTPAQPTNTFIPGQHPPSPVSNVTDMRNALAEKCPSWNNKKIHKKYDSSWKMAAEMHIYEDKRPYTYIVK